MCSNHSATCICHAHLMEPDGKTYILPHPMFARVVMIAGGLFALIMCPWELWRGVWPLNLTSPFFGFIMLGGMSVGAAFLYAGLIAPSAKLRFSPGMIEIGFDYLFGQTRQRVRTDDIEAFEIEERYASEGPNDWYAVIRLKAGKPITSRPLATKEAAEKCLAEFRAALLM